MKLLITALLAALAGMTACGPREASATRDAGRPAATNAGRAATPEPEPEQEQAPEQVPARGPIHPAAVAAAQAHMDGLIADRMALQDTLETVQSTISRFVLRHREPWSPGPDPAQPWDALLGRTLDAPPVNPFSPPAVASRITVVSTPGATGASVSPKTAGWVWNEYDGTLDAAWDSAAIRAAERAEQRRMVRTTYGPYLDSTLRTLRGQVVLYSLYETPLWGPGEVAAQQWVPLIDAGYIFDVPNNPMSPREVAARIVEVTRRGADGGSVSPQTAGWVWNSTDRTLFAAGYREN